VKTEDVFETQLRPVDRTAPTGKINRSALDTPAEPTNQPIATLGVLPSSNAVFGTDTFRNAKHAGFIEVYNSISTQEPQTRDLYLFNSQTGGTLTRVSNNL